MSKDDENDLTPDLIYQFEGQDKQYHLELHQAAKRDRLKYVKEQQLADGSKYRGYLKMITVDDSLDSSL